MAETANSTTWQWRPSTGSVDWLRVGGLCGIFLDGMTTRYVFATDGYRELNPILADLWAIHPGVVTAYFLCFLSVVWITTRRRGWLSTGISATVLVVMGVFGGLNNLMLFVFGSPSSIEWLAAAGGLRPAMFIIAVVPICGLASGLVAVRLRHRRVPWRAVGLAVCLGGVSYLAFLWASRYLGTTTAVVL